MTKRQFSRLIGHITDRLEGDMEMATGVGEAEFAGDLLALPDPTMLSKAGAVYLGARAVDHLYSGWEALRHGQSPETAVHRVVYDSAVGAHATSAAGVLADVADMTIPMEVLHDISLKTGIKAIRVAKTEAGSMTLHRPDVLPEHFSATRPASVPLTSSAAHNPFHIPRPDFPRPDIAPPSILGTNHGLSRFRDTTVRRDMPTHGTPEWYQARHEDSLGRGAANSNTVQFPARYDRFTHAEHEALATSPRHGGHTIAKHVGKPVSYLQERLEQNPRMPAASTSHTEEKAYETTKHVISVKIKEISEWVATARPNERKAFEASIPHNIGTIVTRGRNAPSPANHATIVLKRMEFRGHDYIVLTSYPSEHTVLKNIP